MGAFCLLCDRTMTNITARVYYSAATSTSPAQCRLCRDTARDTILIVFFSLLADGLVVFLLMYYRAKLIARIPAHCKERVSAAWHKFSPYVKFKIIVSFAR